MNEQDQRIAIATACGWKFWQNQYGTWCVTAPDGRDTALPGTPQEAINPTFGRDILSPFGLPDYLADLNAMHEAEKVLDGDIMDSDSLRYTYAKFIYQVTAGENQPFRATAKERAEAFLRTLNLWKE